MLSLNARLLLSATLVVAIFIALTGFAMEAAFQESAATARRERLEAQLYLLLAAAEVEQDGTLAMPANLSEARLTLPGSGLYAQIADGQLRVVWRSPSALGLAIPFHTHLKPGQAYFQQGENASGQRFFISSLGVNWQSGATHYRFTFSISEDLKEFNATLTRYRKSLWGWLGAMAGLLLIAQAIVLRWGLKPLRRVAHDLSAIEEGSREYLVGKYPKELARLTDNLNSLINQQRTRQTRYRNALGDLAHSLKTPLAVLHTTLAGTSLPAAQKKSLDEEVMRMTTLIEHQLQRAATTGSSQFGLGIAIAPVTEKILSSLKKIHAPRQVQKTIPANALFRGSEGDLMELLGNLLDNAYKWSRSRIVVEVEYQPGKLSIAVEDDGPGIPLQDKERIMRRGERADELTPGHGLGLAIVSDICAAYNGHVNVTNGARGGTRITVILPQH